MTYKQERSVIYPIARSTFARLFAYVYNYLAEKYLSFN